ncbi:DUF4145 domain-containing protein [Streptomyces stackebrandtii]|uniref:DUF4145 domain-containing protein n=1 Tax=Streptomyces stackebrandtii TaxID=3051177 RepID=UPI0028DB7260|nr:DUF4145 domain-containing protein [Streptomyces sp. DSM 40976]
MNTQMTRCGWCKHNTVMMPVAHEPLIQHDAVHDDHSVPGSLGWAVFQCAGCRGVSLAQGFYPLPDGYGALPGGGSRLSTSTFMASGWYPTEPLLKTYPDSVPKQIADTAAEAYGCLSVGHYRSAVLMARTVIEGSAKSVGVTVGGIQAKVKELFARGLIYRFVMEAAEEIREAGNEVAHADLIDVPADKAETEALLNLMDRVLDGLFIAPAEPAAQRARREARQESNASGA